MCSTAKTSAIARDPSPIAEIVVDEKTSRKSRSASAPRRSLIRTYVRAASPSTISASTSVSASSSASRACARSAASSASRRAPSLADLST